MDTAFQNFVEEVERRAEEGGDFPATYHAGLDSEIAVSGDDSGITGGGDSTVTFPDLSLLPDNTYIHNLSLNSQRKFAEYLIKSILKPDVEFAPLTRDHLSYWGFSFRFFDEYIQTEIKKTSGDRPPQIEPSENELHPLWPHIKKLESTVEIILLSRLQQQLMQDMSDPRFQFLQSNLPSSSLMGFPIASTIGAPILEGMIRRHSNNLTDDGTVQTNGTLRVREKFGGGYPCGHEISSLGNTLEIWRVTEPSDTVSDILSALDNLNYVDQERIYQKFGYTPPEDRKDGDSLFKEIHNQRNAIIHGESNTMVVSSVLLSLASLLCWAEIEEDDFDLYHDALRRRNFSNFDPYYPTTNSEASDLQ